MANSETEILNFALSKLGAKRVQDINDTGDKKSRTGKIHYDQVRQEVLRAHRWNFALKRTTLSQLADPPEWGFSYQYTLPGDFIRLDQVSNRNLVSSDLGYSGHYNHNGKVEYFEVEGGNSDFGLRLLGNFSEAQIRYVADIKNTAKYDSLFTAAFTTLLASRMARAITGSDTRESELKGQYENMDLPNAGFVDAGETNSNEGHPLDEALRRSTFVNARTPGFRHNVGGPDVPSTPRNIGP